MTADVPFTAQADRAGSAVQAYLLFGDEEYLSMFTEAYVAAMKHLRRPELPWLGEADMHVGEPAPAPWISSLSAFWPGMQVLACMRNAQHSMLSTACTACTQPMLTLQHWIMHDQQQLGTTAAGHMTRDWQAVHDIIAACRP